MGKRVTMSPNPPDVLLWRRIDFRVLLTGHTLAVFADTSVSVVFAVWAKDLSGSTAKSGIVFAAFIAPSFIAPVAGNVIDGLRREVVIGVTNLLLACVVLGMLLATAPQRVWVLYVGAFAYGLGFVIFTSARAGLVVSLFTEQQVGRVNSFLRVAREALRLVAPIVGAGLYGAWGHAAFVMAVATALAGSGVLFLVTRAHQNQPRPSGRPRAVAARPWHGH